MSNWYLFNGVKELGPLTKADLLERLRNSDPARSYVRREGLPDWIAAVHVPELLPHLTLKPIQTPEALDELTAEPSQKKYKAKCTKVGALIGLAIFVADHALEWRGAPLLPWIAGGIAYNLTYILASVGFPALIGLIVGAIIDLANRGRRS